LTGGAPAMHGPVVWGILPLGRRRHRWSLHDAVRSAALADEHACVDSFPRSVRRRLPALSYDAGIPGFGSYSYSWTEVLPVVGVMWEHLGQRSLRVLPKIEAGLRFGLVLESRHQLGALVLWRPGLPTARSARLYNLGGGLTLRAEAGSAGLKLGARLVVLKHEHDAAGHTRRVALLLLSGGKPCCSRCRAGPDRRGASVGVADPSSNGLDLPYERSLRRAVSVAARRRRACRPVAVEHAAAPPAAPTAAPAPPPAPKPAGPGGHPLDIEKDNPY